jgi:type III secretory pathway component EscS
VVTVAIVAEFAVVVVGSFVGFVVAVVGAVIELAEVVGR